MPPTHLSRALRLSQATRFAHSSARSRRPLPIYKFDPSVSTWQPTPFAKTAGLSAPIALHVLTWNVDFMAEQRRERFQCILDHIRHTVFHCSSGDAPDPSVLLLQEIRTDVIPVLLHNDWIQTHFIVTPMSNSEWPGYSRYGVVTLVSHDVPVISASSLDFVNSKMLRNALLLDVQLNPAGRPISDTGTTGRDGFSRNARVNLRMANVHLESMRDGAAEREEQLALVAQALKKRGIKAGLVCGDMNAMTASDEWIVASAKLLDAYTGEDDDSIGHTWGYQPTRSFLPGRLDKVLYTPNRGLIVREPQRIGVGLKTSGGLWASDHYGLLTTVTVIKK